MEIGMIPRLGTVSHLINKQKNKRSMSVVVAFQIKEGKVLLPANSKVKLGSNQVCAKDKKDVTSSFAETPSKLNAIRLNLLRRCNDCLAKRDAHELDSIISRHDSHILAVYKDCLINERREEFLSKCYKRNESAGFLRRFRPRREARPNLMQHGQYEIVERGYYKKAKAKFMRQLSFHQNAALMTQSYEPFSLKKLIDEASRQHTRDIAILDEEKRHGSIDGKEAGPHTEVKRVVTIKEERTANARNAIFMSECKPHKVIRIHSEKDGLARLLKCGVFLCTPKDGGKEPADNVYFSECLVKTKDKQCLPVQNRVPVGRNCDIVKLLNSHRDSTAQRLDWIAQRTSTDKNTPVGRKKSPKPKARRAQKKKAARAVIWKKAECVYAPAVLLHGGKKMSLFSPAKNSRVGYRTLCTSNMFSGCLRCQRRNCLPKKS